MKREITAPSKVALQSQRANRFILHSGPVHMVLAHKRAAPTLNTMELLIGVGVGIVVLFGIARLVFGAQVAVLLAGVVGACLGGAAAGGVGIIVGLVLIPLTSVFGLLITPDET